MASTRGKNAPGGYACWKHEAASFQNYSMYAGQSKPQAVAHPGLGLLGAKMPNTTLSPNSVDLESALRGLGSSGLERPVHAPPVTSWSLPRLNIYRPSDVHLCDPLVVDADPRYTVFGGNSCSRQ